MLFEIKKTFSKVFFQICIPMIFCYKSKVPHITVTYCMLYRHTLVAKSLPEKLKHVRTNKGCGNGVEPVRKFIG